MKEPQFLCIPNTNPIDFTPNTLSLHPQLPNSQSKCFNLHRFLYRRPHDLVGGATAHLVSTQSKERQTRTNCVTKAWPENKVNKCFLEFVWNFVVIIIGTEKKNNKQATAETK